MALARPTVGVVLEHGFFNESQADVTSSTLAAFAAGMFALSAYLFILRGFYAHNDTRTPFVINVFENSLNILVALVLVGPFGVPGLAWSFTVAYIVAAVFAFYVLTVKMRGINGRALVASLARIALAAIVTGEVAWIVSQAVGADSGSGAFVRLSVGVVAGAITYVALLVFLRVPEAGEVQRRAGLRTSTS